MKNVLIMKNPILIISLVFATLFITANGQARDKATSLIMSVIYE